MDKMEKKQEGVKRDPDEAESVSGVGRGGRDGEEGGGGRGLR